MKTPTLSGASSRLDLLAACLRALSVALSVGELAGDDRRRAVAAHDASVSHLRARAPLALARLEAEGLPFLRPAGTNNNGSGLETTSRTRPRTE